MNIGTTGSARRVKPALGTSLGPWLLAVAIASGCQPKDPCDPGWKVQDSVCVEIAPDDGSGGADTTADAGPMPDAGGGLGIAECSPGQGDASAFGKTCATHADCACPAPVCLPDPFFSCNMIDCKDDPERCPDGYSCAEIPPAFQQDGITNVCLPGG